ncbi:hypothetical protein [Streptomyces sp. NBRC 110465]|uniref:hypothetical protein n=1 Tax=Streptomyces sp. NBRC 110465 TaxID=1897621 RepID=UPI000934DCB3|nr:hypothetical protein [Streptomyces sp. NBRC 110465]
MTRTPNEETGTAAGAGLPKGAGPIDTGTPVRRPGTPAPETRTVTGKEADPVRPPAQAPGTGGRPEEAPGDFAGDPAQAPHTTAARPAEAPGAAPGPTAPDPALDAPEDPRATHGLAAPEHGSAGAERSSGDTPGLGKPLFAPAEQDAFAARIQQAVTGFVEDPHRAVRDADTTFEEVVADLGAALAERGRRLRSGKDADGADSGPDTEDLRIALQHYRDLTERLVRL